MNRPFPCDLASIKHFLGYVTAIRCVEAASTPRAIAIHLSWLATLVVSIDIFQSQRNIRQLSSLFYHKYQFHNSSWLHDRDCSGQKEKVYTVASKKSDAASISLPYEPRDDLRIEEFSLRIRFKTTDVIVIMQGKMHDHQQTARYRSQYSTWQILTCAFFLKKKLQNAEEWKLSPYCRLVTDVVKTEHKATFGNFPWIPNLCWICQSFLESCCGDFKLSNFPRVKLKIRLIILFSWHFSSWLDSHSKGGIKFQFLLEVTNSSFSLNIMLQGDR